MKIELPTSTINNVALKVRTNNSLRKQAEFINRLKEGDIWSNVIIIVKQSVNPKYDARGALAAMQDFADTCKVAVLGYRYVSDQAFSDKQRDMILSNSAVKEVFNVMTEAEIRDVVNNKINNIECPVRILFSDSVCVDCGEEGDPRLLSDWCHMEPCQIHPASASPRHPGGVSRHHPTDRLSQVHPGHVAVGRCGRLCGCGPCSRPRYCTVLYCTVLYCTVLQVLLLWQEGEHGGLQAAPRLLSEPSHGPRLSVAVQVLRGPAGQLRQRLHQHLHLLWPLPGRGGAGLSDRLQEVWPAVGDPG